MRKRMSLPGLWWILALCLVGTFAACQKSETPPAPEEKSATGEPSPEPRAMEDFEIALENRPETRETSATTPSRAASGREIVEPDFDPFLFRHRDRTMQYVVEIPPRPEEEIPEEGAATPEVQQLQQISVAIVEKFPEMVKVNLSDRTVVRLRVAVECADEASMEALKKNPENQRLVQAAIENRTSDELLTLEGKMAFKSDLIARLKASLPPQVRGIKEVHLMEFTIGAY